jgi:hypothetical protein
MHIEPIFVQQPQFAEAVSKLRAGDADLALDPRLELAHSGPEVTRDEAGIGADILQRARDDPFGLTPPRRRKVP